MDANYVAGFVLSDDQHVGQDIHARVQTFGKRQKHTLREISKPRLVSHVGVLLRVSCCVCYGHITRS